MRGGSAATDEQRREHIVTDIHTVPQERDNAEHLSFAVALGRRG